MSTDPSALDDVALARIRTICLALRDVQEAGLQDRPRFRVGRRRFAPSPHHGDRGWMALRLDGRVDWDEIAELLESAHRQVAPRAS
ncbi:MAG TPA: hypothetical protein VGO60_10000 [Iamia sp.]|jgi:hypothetical protein|nr:hypothetical protein [Iamia sp.]